MKNNLHREGGAAFQAGVFLHRSMQFIYPDISGILMQPVNILGDDSPQDIPLFQLCQVMMRGIRTCGREQHILPVEIKKQFRMQVKECTAQHRFRTESFECL